MALRAAGPRFGTDSPAAAWRPSAEYLDRSRLRRFLTDVGCADLPELQARAVADPAWFWSAAVADFPSQRRIFFWAMPGLHFVP